MQRFANCSDEELIRQCQKGAEEAFMALYLRYRQPIMNFAFRMVGNYEDAADVFQDTFRYIFTKVKTYKPDAKFSTLVYQVARHNCIDILRKRDKPVKPLSESPADDTSITDPLTILEKREAAANTQQALEKLPHIYREVIVLRYGQELSYEDISKILDVPLGTVQSRLNTAILMLRDKVHKNERR